MEVQIGKITPQFARLMGVKGWGCPISSSGHKWGCHSDKVKGREKVPFAKGIGDGVAGLKESSRVVGWTVGVQKMGLCGINGEIKSWRDGIGNGGDSTKMARPRIEDLKLLV